MGLIGINAVSNNPVKKTIMEQIAEGVDAASKLTNAGVNAYEVFGVKKPESEARSRWYDAQSSQKNYNPTYMSATDAEIKAGRAHHPLTATGVDTSLSVVPVNTVAATINADARETSDATKSASSQADKIEKDAQLLIRSLDTAKASSRSALGKAANTFNASSRIEALANLGNPDFYKMTHEQQTALFNSMSPQQVFEMARAADAVISQTGATIAGTEHLLPKSVVGDFNSFKNYILNDPKGAGMGGFVQQLYDTTMREKQLARNQMDAETNAVARASEGGRLAKYAPDRFNAIIENAKKSMFDLSEANNQKVGAIGSPLTPTLSQEDQNAVNWAKANPQDPRSQTILNMHGIH